MSMARRGRRVKGAEINARCDQNCAVCSKLQLAGNFTVVLHLQCFFHLHSISSIYTVPLASLRVLCHFQSRVFHVFNCVMTRFGALTHDAEF